MAKRRQPATRADNGADTRLVALGQELRRTIRRANRQRTQVTDSPDWLLTLDHAQGLVDQISAVPANGIEGVAVKLRAITWFLDSTDAVLDLKGLRQLRDLDWEARRLSH